LIKGKAIFVIHHRCGAVQEAIKVDLPPCVWALTTPILLTGATSVSVCSLCGPRTYSKGSVDRYLNGGMWATSEAHLVGADLDWWGSLRVCSAGRVVTDRGRERQTSSLTTRPFEFLHSFLLT
jgi:hypothetical protein